jgi:hypothetical protein
MFVNGSEQNEQSLQRTFQGCFLLSFDSFGQAVSEEKIKMCHRQFMFMIVCFLKKNQFFCGKRDNSNLNIDIYFSIKNEQSLQRTFQGCFLLSFDSFGQAVSEEKIKM